jgi:septum formation topological specificity factor MinE
MTEDVGLPAVESPLGQQILQVIQDYIDAHQEMADVEVEEHIDRAMHEVQSMNDFVRSLRPPRR